MKPLVIFDMDGVIVNSEPHHIAACERIVRRISGGRIGAKEAHTVGISTVELYRRALEMCGAEGDPAALAAEHFTTTLGEIRRAIPNPEPELLRLMDALERRGVRMAVATSSPGSFVEGVLTLYGIMDRFETVVTGSDAARLKPAPDVYLLALSRCGVPAADAAAIEDSRIGVEAALAAGLYCYGFVNLGSGKQDLSRADRRIHSLLEVLEPDEAQPADP